MINFPGGCEKTRSEKSERIQPQQNRMYFGLAFALTLSANLLLPMLKAKLFAWESQRTLPGLVAVPIWEARVLQQYLEESMGNAV